MKAKSERVANYLVGEFSLTYCRDNLDIEFEWFALVKSHDDKWGVLHVRHLITDWPERKQSLLAWAERFANHIEWFEDEKTARQKYERCQR